MAGANLRQYLGTNHIATLFVSHVSQLKHVKCDSYVPGPVRQTSHLLWE